MNVYSSVLNNWKAGIFSFSMDKQTMVLPWIAVLLKGLLTKTKVIMYNITKCGII